MLSWIQANAGSVAVAAVLLAAVALIVRRLALDRKAGKHICGGSCGSGCANCPMHGQCRAG